jgi:hypothetical protein
MAKRNPSNPTGSSARNGDRPIAGNIACSQNSNVRPVPKAPQLKDILLVDFFQVSVGVDQVAMAISRHG